MHVYACSDKSARCTNKADDNRIWWVIQMKSNEVLVVILVQ